MNILPQIDVNMSGAFAKFSPAGIPEAVRSNLRRTLPDLTKTIGASVEDKLNTQLKSRVSLEVKKELVENPTTIQGRITVKSAKNPLLPEWLESGTMPHDIAAKNVLALRFNWPVMGGFVFFKKVHHPGFAGIHYMERTFSEYQDMIVDRITDAVEQGAKGH